MTVVDEGDLVAPIPEIKAAGDPHKKYIREISKVCERLYKTALAALEKGGVPLVLGGDHSLAAGSVAATADFVRRSDGQDRAHLGRRARRHEHAGVERQRQRPRHAARVAARPGTGGAVANRRVLAEGATRAHGADRHPQSRRAGEGDRARVRRARLHDEGHRPRRHRDGDGTGAGDCRQRDVGRARVVRPRRVRPGDRTGRRNAREGRPRLSRGSHG